MCQKFSIILIGGSAGCLPPLIDILQALPNTFSIPIVVVMHRQKNVASSLDKILSGYSPYFNTIEPEDKEVIMPCSIYLAPQNYHLLFEYDNTFSLDYSEPILYSRPAIDVSFESAAAVYGKVALAILLSGANSDGSKGVEGILSCGGTAIVQDPASALYKAMPQAALERNPGAMNLVPENIVSFVIRLIS